MKLPFYTGDVSKSGWKVKTSKPMTAPEVREKVPSLTDGV